MMRRLLVLLWVLCGLATGEARADVEYHGETSLWQDTVWSGRVLVDGILTVPVGVTLELRPGTEVRFTRRDSNGDGIGENEIFIQGVLIALGTAEAPIRFTSGEADPRPGDWGAINMMASEEENRLEHCRVEFGYRGFHAHFASAALKDCVFAGNLRGMQFQESTVSIERCLVEDNFNGMQFRNSEVRIAASRVRGNHWGIRSVYSELTMHDCDITDNLVNGVNLRDSTLAAERVRVTANRKGIYLQGSKGQLRGSDLSGNSEHGILLEESDVLVTRNRISGNGRAGVRWLNSSGSLRDNQLSGNGTYALINDGSGPVDARSNAWRTLDPAGLAAMIRDGGDRPGMGLVDAAAPLPSSSTGLP